LLPGSAARRVSRPLGEVLEGHQLLSTFTVTSNGEYNANGTVESGSLLWMINRSKGTSGTSTNTILDMLLFTIREDIRPSRGMTPCAISGRLTN
jgi:hypothetical protein